VVEAAGVEPASDAASAGTSTSVSEILISPSGLLPTGSRAASGGFSPGPEPPRLRTGKPALVTPLSRPAGAAGGGARDLGPGTRPYATYAARASAGFSLAFVLPCAVTHTPSARYPEAQLPRRDQTPPRVASMKIVPALDWDQRF